VGEENKGMAWMPRCVLTLPGGKKTGNESQEKLTAKLDSEPAKVIRE